LIISKYEINGFNMIKRIFIQHNLLITIFAGIISVSCMVAFALYVEPGLDPSGDTGLIDLQLAFTKGRAEKILSAWGSAGQNHFLKTIWIDFIYPVAYALLLSSLIILIHGKKRFFLNDSKINLLLSMPAFSALLDMIENVIEIVFVYNHDLISAKTFFVHSLIASLKWTLAGVTVSYILVIVVILIIRRVFLKPSSAI
jgi:hypothetical protein